MRPKTSPRRLKTAPRRPQDAPRLPRRPQDAPKTPPRSGKFRAQQWIFSGPPPQTLPRRLKTPKTAPRRAQDAPRTPPGRPKTPPREQARWRGRGIAALKIIIAYFLAHCKITIIYSANNIFLGYFNSIRR